MKPTIEYSKFIIAMLITIYRLKRFKKLIKSFSIRFLIRFLNIDQSLQAMFWAISDKEFQGRRI